ADDAALDTLVDVLFPHHLDADDAFDPTDTGRSDAPMRLFELVDRALAAARRPTERATAEYLAAVLYERCALPLVAEEHLVRAAAAQSHLGSVVERLGWYRFDRGDADGALRWWRRLSDVHPAAALLESFTSSRSTPRLGRNDPCWCGSGRKFKQCHLGASELPALPDRVTWLCRKASLWLEHSTGEGRERSVEMAVARALGNPEGGEFELRALGDEEASRRLQEAWADPIVFDTALHEGGLFQLFLHERGALLPDDEQLLAASWLTVERSVHEVVALERGSSLTLRDLATGEVVQVRERTASRQATVGELYCARVVPDGESHQIVGGVFSVPAGHESTVLDLCAERDGEAICAWVGALFAPPSVVHSPGMIDSMIDRAAVDSAIAALGDDADEAAVIAAINAEFARQAQAHWLDDHVPALGGLTPREAAADPTRREQLVRLLDEFDRRNEALDELAGEGDGVPEGFRPMSYDVAALRRELGLT
ncbi:MAG TPA: SEC-C domain-containing protein, partial [Ilumatobacter sp.]|nr:SEC-C domain-containing protein [Ilumatobacter sp.]